MTEGALNLDSELHGRSTTAERYTAGSQQSHCSPLVRTTNQPCKNYHYESYYTLTLYKTSRSGGKSDICAFEQGVLLILVSRALRLTSNRPYSTSGIGGSPK